MGITKCHQSDRKSVGFQIAQLYNKWIAIKRNRLRHPDSNNNEVPAHLARSETWTFFGRRLKAKPRHPLPPKPQNRREMNNAPKTHDRQRSSISNLRRFRSNLRREKLDPRIKRRRMPWGEPWRDQAEASVRVSVSLREWRGRDPKVVD